MKMATLLITMIYNMQVPPKPFTLVISKPFYNPACTKGSEPLSDPTKSRVND